MPQFEMTHLVSQVFWLVVSFFVLYLGIKYIIFPMFNNIFQKRQIQIDTLLNQAENFIQKTQQLENEIEIRKQKQEKRFNEKISLTQEKSSKLYQAEVEKVEKSLMKSLQTKIQKMEAEEKKILENSDGFTSLLLKGNK